VKVTPFLFFCKYCIELIQACNATIQASKEAGTYKVERVITSSQSAEITVAGGKRVLNFCANNYLGLSDHPRVREGAKKAIDTHGFGMSSVRFICGTQDIHKQLEARIAKFHKLEDAILYPSAFDANAGFFEAVLSPEDAIISDELNHASIIDGIRLCKAKRLRYKHLDLGDLEKQLQDADGSRLKVIVTDGVFSMDGDIAPLPEIVGLAKKYGAFTFVDECHASGVLGKTGRGTPEYFNLEGQIDVINSTLGKALGGGTGGYSAASKEVVDILRQKGRPYLFSNSIAPPVVGASLEVFDMIDEPVGA
jgi:glycine C-acetyltransferase